MITIFTDGASRGNPGPGGFGAIVVDQERQEVAELGGREDKTTNNRMELRAAAEALEYVDASEMDGDIELYTDSRYVVHGITKWIKGWKKRGWLTKNKTDVVNRDLWERLEIVTGRLEGVEWKLLPGHSGVPGNERADEIATTFADEDLPGLYNGPLLEYPVDILRIEVDTEAEEERKRKKKRAQAQAYSYVSLVDGKVCRHSRWDSCEARVKGKSAKFRKTISAEDEKRIVESWGYSVGDIEDCDK